MPWKINPSHGQWQQYDEADAYGNPKNWLRGPTYDFDPTAMDRAPVDAAGGGTTSGSGPYLPPVTADSLAAQQHNAQWGSGYSGGTSSSSSGSGTRSSGGSRSSSSSGGFGSGGGSSTLGADLNGFRNQFSVQQNPETAFLDYLKQMQGNQQGQTDSAASARNLQQVMDHLEGLQNQANSANELRYQQMLNKANHLGQQATNRIQQQGAQAKAQTAQSAISRGLGNSTVVDALQRGVQRNMDDQLLGVEEARQRMKIGIIGDRTDAGPNLGLYGSLLSQPGAVNALGSLWGKPAGTTAPATSGTATNTMAAAPLSLSWQQDWQTAPTKKRPLYSMNGG